MKNEKNFNLCYLFVLQRELSDSMKQKIRAEYEAVGGSPDKPLPTNYFLNINELILYRYVSYGSDCNIKSC
ncbi:hypothetical protein Leryth_023068 [Lithospermum erythrorhizon]|nr:hypothetical protein Leryth_023068 [Lithospermum erythrorhizon]